MRHLLWLLLVVWTVASAAPVVYVDDFQRVGVRADPSSTTAPIEVVTTGDKLTVLKSNSGYLKVRTPKGAEGWVNSRYVTKQPPARLRIGPLQTRYDQLKARQATLEQSLKASRDKVAQITQENAQLKQRNGVLSRRLDTRNRSSIWSNPWIYVGAAMILLFVLGLVVGMRHDRQRIARRLGGMEL